MMARSGASTVSRSGDVGCIGYARIAEVGARGPSRYTRAMLRFRTVLFDLDGTLIDSIRLILDSYHHTAAAFGVPAQPDAVWLAGIGTPLRSQLGPWAADAAALDAMVAE